MCFATDFHKLMQCAIDFDASRKRTFNVTAVAVAIAVVIVVNTVAVIW